MFYIKKKEVHWQCSGCVVATIINYISLEKTLKYLPEVEVDTVSTVSVSSKCGKMIMNETLAVLTTFSQILQGETIR